MALLRHSVSAKALAYGWLIDSRYLVFFLATWVVAERGSWLQRSWPKLVLVPAGFVVAVGLLQRFLLPHDVLRHFGYSHKTIPAFETIDHKVQYLRIQSTLRGANLLGAYMIIVVSVLGSLFRRYQLVASVLLALVVVFASGSRGAWVGVLAALAVLVVLKVPGRRAKELVLAGGMTLLLLGAGTVFVLRHNDFVQNTVFHSDENSKSSESSNAAHFRASHAALKQVFREPLGRGPGTAGPASAYNKEGSTRIAENYFLQIAQEYGWLGFILCVAIYVLTGKRLWQRRHDPLARALFASLLGITCVALLMHIWADETIAFLFWGLTGVALAGGVVKRETKTS